MSAQRWQDVLSPSYDSPNQAWLTAHWSQPLGRLLAALAFRLGQGPNVLTYTGLILSLLGCVLFGIADVSGASVLAVVIVWQVAFALDCADGQLARATRGGSEYGAWLDIFCDLVRQAGIGVAVGLRLGQAGIDGGLIALVEFSFLAGSAAYLYSVAVIGMVKRRDAQAMPTGGSRWRSGFVALLDTPLFLLLLPLLSTTPLALGIYVGAYGGLLLMRGWLAGRRWLASGG